MPFIKEFWNERREELKEKLKLVYKKRRGRGGHNMLHTEKTKKELRETALKQYDEGKVSPFKNMTYKQRLKQVQTRKDRNKYIRSFEMNKQVSATLQGIKIGDWKGFSEGVYPLKFYIMRKFIFRRDGFRCRICNVSRNNSILHIHHIDGNKENNSFFNLITLCLNCHMSKIHYGEMWKGFLLREVVNFPMVIR